MYPCSFTNGGIGPPLIVVYFVVSKFIEDVVPLDSVDPRRLWYWCYRNDSFRSDYRGGVFLIPSLHFFLSMYIFDSFFASNGWRQSSTVVILSLSCLVGVGVLAEHYNLFRVMIKQRLSCFSQIVVWKEPQVVEFLLVLLRFVSIVLASF